MLFHGRGGGYEGDVMIMSCDAGEWEVGKEVKEKLAELGAKSLKKEVRFPSLNVYHKFIGKWCLR